MGVKIKNIKLRRGTATRIAEKLELSVPHVSLVLRGKREAGEALAAEIYREAAKQSKAAA